MIEITVMLYGKRVHFFTHLEAVIKDLATGRSFYINFPTMQPLNESAKNAEIVSDSSSKYSNFAGQVTLYSNRNLDHFIDSFYHEYGDKGGYQVIRNNCSSAVNFALNYFFPEETIIKLNESIHRSLFCCFSLSCCCVSCCPLPPCIDTPTDIFKLATSLSKIYGDKNKEEKYFPDEKDSKCNSFNVKEMKNSGGCFNALTLAIINDEQDLTMHFIEQHFNELTEKQICFAYLCCVAAGKGDIAEMLFNKKPGYFEEDNKMPIDQSFSNEELNVLLALSIKNNTDLQFIKSICEYYSKSFMRSKQPEEMSCLELAFRCNRMDVVHYFINEYAKIFTPKVLGWLLICLIIINQYDLALTLLAKRPDADKNFWLTHDNQSGMLHRLVKNKQDPSKLFSLLCESKPVADLTLKNKEGQTALDIAIKNHHVAVVHYIFENHRKKLSEDQLATASKFLSEHDVYHKRKFHI